MTLSYPPFHLFFPSFICLVPAILLLERGANDRLPFRRQVAQGFWFGLLTNGLLLYWMVFALWRFTPLSVLAYGGTILLLSLFGAVLFGITGWITRVSKLSIVVVFPVLWTSLEWLTGHMHDIRFPWLGLGTSLTGYPTAVQIADIVGARGITLMLATANSVIAVAFVRRGDLKRSALLFAAVLLGVIAAYAYGLVRERTLEMSDLGEVALVQPNVGFREKWNTALQDSLVGDLLALSSKALTERDPDLVAWPEAAVPGDLRSREDWTDRISSLVSSVGRPFLVGGLHSARDSDGRWVRYNSAFFFDSFGVNEVYPVYHKQYLVPVTERVPFIRSKWLDIRWLGRFGSGDGGPIYQSELGSFGVLICYESTFENLARDYRRNGADFLVNITNDAWFEGTSTPYQHVSHLVMRAIENRVGIARAANSGITEYVDPLGREYGRIRAGVAGVVSDTVRTSDTLALYTRLGDWVGHSVLLLTALLLGYSWWSMRSKTICV